MCEREREVLVKCGEYVGMNAVQADETLVTTNTLLLCVAING